MTRTLKVFSFDGIHTDSLGNYLTGLGLLAATSQRWPGIRGCWRDGRFLLLSDEVVNADAISTFLLREWKPTNYERWWATFQKADTKAKSSAKLWHERNQRSLAEVRLVDSHVVGMGRNRFNPVFGTGGNVGKRDLSKAWKDSIKLLSKPDSMEWLSATLSGGSSESMPNLASAGTWFVFANKTFNSGQDWYREGRLSPWSFLLAMEGAFQLVGDVNRRLGSRARPYAVFPFISEPSLPENDGELGMSRAEFWAPLWSSPASLLEVRSLLRRGLARLGGRPAQAPHEFAVAAMIAGVDGGISEFARYELRQTTSSQVFEAIPRERIRVQSESRSPTQDESRAIASRLLASFLESGWMNRLPPDTKQPRRFFGLRGPIEAAIIRIGERPQDGERWQDLLFTLAAAQAHIDRDKALRDRCKMALPLLSPDWFARAWPVEMRTDEIEVASAIASVGWASSRPSKNVPLLSNVFGIEVSRRSEGCSVQLPTVRPAQAVWGSGDPLQVLLDVGQRRLIDGENSDTAPFTASLSCHVDVVNRLLWDDGSLDLEIVAKWVPALSLIDWSRPCPQPARHYRPMCEADGTALLHALVRPLFYCCEAREVRFRDGTQLFRNEQQPKPNLLRRLFHLLRFNAIDETLQVLRDRYLAVGRAIVEPPMGLEADGPRIAAALLIPLDSHAVANGLERWLQPAKSNR